MYLVTLDDADKLVHVFGFPSTALFLFWVARRWEKGQAEFKKLADNTTAAVQGIAVVQKQVDTIENNHLKHLQDGIESVAKSNDKAVEILQEINKGITVVLDRVPR